MAPMKIVRRSLVRTAIALIAALAASTGRGQNYGTNDQVLSIDATSFLGFGVEASEQADGYIYKQNAGDIDVFAPLAMPNGARITQICLYARNEDVSNVVRLSLEAVKLVVSGQSPPGVVMISGTQLVADFHDGYREVCSGPLSYVVHETTDADNDGTPELVAHRLRAFLPNGTFALGGARITWHRQVSPPPLTATFPDVPTGHPFYEYVEALYAAGITAGYGNGFFGVNDPISRGQMAAFLAKALGLHWPF
jgi:S-layer homology domain